MAKNKLFKFRDGLREVKAGDMVWEVNSDRRGSTGGPKFIVKVGVKLITIAHSLTNYQNYNTTQYYLETGRVKSDYNLGLTLYSSEEGMKRYHEERKTIEKCAQAVGGNLYGVPESLTYDKACRILKILEEM
jgi:hypothetical protein